MRKTGQASGIFSLLFFFLLFSVARGQSIVRISAEDHRDFTRVAIASTFPLNYSIEKQSASILVRIESKTLFRIQREPRESRLIKSFGWSKRGGAYILTVETTLNDFRFEHFIVRDPYQLVIDVHPEDKGREDQKDDVTVSAEKVAEAETRSRSISSPPSSPLASRPQRSTREDDSSKRIRTIVIDPGHGGIESGARGKFGALEKDITLAVSRKLKAIIEKNLALRVVLTRDRDIEVSLDNRAALANNNKADLFISIHTNSSRRILAQGSETFFLSLNATDEEARRLAYLENSSEVFEERIDKENEDEIKMILWDMAQAAYIKQSSQFAEIIQQELNVLLGTLNRGIKQAPFKVLTGVACPAVLVEVAFISNPEEERKLVTEEFQENVAQAIYRGLARYIRLYSQS